MARMLCDKEPANRSNNVADHRRSSMPCNIDVRTVDAATPHHLRFDTDTWVAMLDEQRRIIAAAAGVDPSKVRINIGN